MYMYVEYSWNTKYCTVRWSRVEDWSERKEGKRGEGGSGEEEMGVKWSERKERKRGEEGEGVEKKGWE